MKILVTCIHYPVASGRYITWAFKRLGHDVRSHGPSTGNQIWGGAVDEKWAWFGDYDPSGNWRPDLIVAAESAYFAGSVPGLVGVPTVLWGQDNHTRDYRFTEGDYDALFLAHSWAHRMDEPNAYWLPPCYDPEYCRDLGLERDLDVVMVGYPYPERVTLIEALRAAGLKVIGGLGLVYDEYNALYNRAKIAFVKSSQGDVTNRVFENAAQGCCVLADRAKDFDKLDWKPYRDYVPYDDADDLVRKATALVQADKWREYAMLGQAAAQPHTWEARAREVLRVVSELEPIGA